MNVILFGIQGSGKGTQAKLLSQKIGLEHVSIGDLFRKNIEQKTELGKIVNSFIEKGELVPDKYVLGIVKNALDASESKKGFILDGFPRNPEQGKYLLKNYKIDGVILLELTDENALQRLLARRLCQNCKKDYNLLFHPPQKKGICDVCGGEVVQRKDDNEKAIKIRLQKFHEETEQVIKVFQEKDLIIKINADQSVESIQSEILTKLNFNG